MNDVTDVKVNSIVSLKDYTDKMIEILSEHISDLERCKADRDTVNTRFEATATATELAAKTMEMRLILLNNLREEVVKLGDLYTTRIEHHSLIDRVDGAFERLDDDIRYLRESKAMIDGKASQEAVSKVSTFAIIGIALSLMSLSCGGLGLLLSIIMLLYP